MPRSVSARTYDALSTMNLDFAPHWLKTYMRMSLCALALSAVQPKPMAVPHPRLEVPEGEL